MADLASLTLPIKNETTGVITPTRYDIPTGGSVTVDSALSGTSENPVQNKAVTAALENKANASDVHNIPSGGTVGQVLAKLSDTDYDAEWMSALFVTPQMFGAVGDGVTDDTAAFNLAQNSGYNVYVPAGVYLVTDFVFSTSITWVFQRSKNNHWFELGGAWLLSATSTTISCGVKIYNLRMSYGGTETDVSNCPVCLKVAGSFFEIHGFYENGWYIGMDFGNGAGGNSAYGKIYDAYCWYNYYCGVRIATGNSGSANYISFYDCNFGSNGVSPHDVTVEPDTTRGYGMYFETCNDIFVSNADLSANETCAIFIDNSAVTKQTRGLSIPTFYAEGNKYCDIYYKNAMSPETTRTGNIDIGAPFIPSQRNNASSYYVGQVHADATYIPPCVNFFGCPKTEFRDGAAILLDLASDTFPIDVDASSKNFRFFGIKGASYKINLKLLGRATGSQTWQNLILNSGFDDDYGYYFINNRITALAAFGIPVTEGEETDVTVFVTMPTTGTTELCCFEATAYGSDAEVIGGSIEKVDMTYSTVKGTPGEGTTRIYNNALQVYLDGAWKTVTVT